MRISMGRGGSRRKCVFAVGGPLGGVLVALKNEKAYPGRHEHFRTSHPDPARYRRRAFRRGRSVDAIRLLLLTTLGEMEDHVMRYVAAVLVVTMLFAAGCCCARKQGSTAQQSAENRPTSTTVSDRVELE